MLRLLAPQRLRLAVSRTITRSFRTRSLTQHPSNSSPSNPSQNDAGASFAYTDPSDEQDSEHGSSSSAAAAANSSPFRRTSSSAAGILTPRPARSSDGSQQPRRADDPQAELSRAMIGRMSTMEVKGRRDSTVPIGGSSSGQPDTEASLAAKSLDKNLPQKGGRAIHPKDVVEQKGKLTPIQMHRILATLQQEPEQGGSAGESTSGGGSGWTSASIAAAYDVDVHQIDLLRQHLRLPFVFQDSHRDWRGSPSEPAHVMIQRSLGNEGAGQTPLLGGHLRVEKRKPNT